MAECGGTCVGEHSDHHTIRGIAKMRTRMGLALAVMLALALGFISEGKPELMRSLVGSTRALRVA